MEVEEGLGAFFMSDVSLIPRPLPPEEWGSGLGTRLEWC